MSVSACRYYPALSPGLSVTERRTDWSQHLMNSRVLSGAGIIANTAQFFVSAFCDEIFIQSEQSWLKSAFDIIWGYFFHLKLKIT